MANKPDFKPVPNQAYTLVFPFGPDPVWSGPSKQNPEQMRYCWTVRYNNVEHSWFASQTVANYISSAPLHGRDLTLDVTHTLDGEGNHGWKIFALGEDQQTWVELADPGNQAPAAPAAPAAPDDTGGFPPPPAHVGPPAAPGGSVGVQDPTTPSAPPLPFSAANPAESRPKAELGKQELAQLFTEALVLSNDAWHDASLVDTPVNADVLYKTAFTLWREFVQRKFTPNPVPNLSPHGLPPGAKSGQGVGGDGGPAQPAVPAGAGSGPDTGVADGPPPPTEHLNSNQITFRRRCEALKTQIINASGNDVTYYTVLEGFGWKNAAAFDGTDTPAADRCLTELTKCLGALMEAK